MIIVNADDWGRSPAETDAAARCFAEGRITSVSAMVFMDDSLRAAELAKRSGLDVGLHLNLTQPFSGPGASRQMIESQARVVRFLTRNKYALVVYNPLLRREFRATFQAQLDEFVRLYGKLPSHIDGHHHRHLCANVLLDDVIPEGMKVRRNFFFWPDEKGACNRTYRRLVDGWLARRYVLTDFFFALSQCLSGERMRRVLDLARTGNVEVMTHPASVRERAYLMGEPYLVALGQVEKGTYAAL